MWSDRKSLVLSKCCVVLFMALLLAGVIYASSEGALMLRIMSDGRRAFFLATIYAGSVPTAVLLVLLYGLLRRIGAGQVFISKNSECLRYISWCCFAGALISVISAVYWIAWFAVGVSAAFMGLIVRVIKNVFAKAVSLQDDADFTI
ncbi:MAG: DUF2975 domain-containing protein [Oscillospiraceae bacterium]|nr:DUF2975 domain-containing protein [Oscillospiraceae bacterium]